MAAIPHIPERSATRRRFRSLRRSSFGELKVNVTTAVSFDGTLIIPMLNSTGFVMLDLAYGHCPMESIPFALDTANLARPHMVNLVKDPSIARHLVIALRVQYTVELVMVAGSQRFLG